MDVKQIYQKADAYLKGHFLLSSKKHSEYYLQSAKVLEDPLLAETLAKALAKQIQESSIHVDAVCSPAIGGLLAGYELARALKVRFIFTERVQNDMTLRRGFEVRKDERFIICEDVITTGGSALESAQIIEKNGAKVVAFAALANRGFCKRVGGMEKSHMACKLPADVPLFALEDFTFDIYEPESCPLCKTGLKAYKPGSRQG